jgi:tetratricopeptide (TPR) repeat protein
LKEGYILTPAFAEKLAVFEAQDTAMRTYFPDLLETIDLKHEQKRVANVKFVTERAVRTVHVQPPAAPAPLPLTGAAKTLDDAEKAFAEHNSSDRKMDAARELFLRVLQETDQNPMHAKAYYGLARASLAENDPDAAERLFHKALDLDPDPTVKSWCLLYLGRLSDNMQGGREQAQEFYKAALAVTGVPEQVRKAAEQGLNQAFNPSTK